MLSGLTVKSLARTQQLKHKLVTKKNIEFPYLWDAESEAHQTWHGDGGSQCQYNSCSLKALLDAMYSFAIMVVLEIWEKCSPASNP